MELLFPDDGSKVELEQRMMKNLGRTEKIMELFADEDLQLNEVSKRNPKKAVETVLRLLNEPVKKSSPDPMVKKEHLGSVASGSPTGGKKGTMTLEQIKAELKAMCK